MQHRMIKKALSVIGVLGLTLSMAQAATQLDPAASTVLWKGTKKVGSSHHGHVSVKGGQLEMNKKGELTGGNIVVDMKTIVDEDLKDDPSSQKKLQGHLASGDFFNVEKFPEATFKINSVTQKGKGEVMIKGDLTMIGKTGPVEFPAKLSTANGVTTGDASFKVDRTKWDLKYNSGNFFKDLAGDKIINDDIEFTVKLVTKK